MSRVRRSLAILLGLDRNREPGVAPVLAAVETSPARLQLPEDTSLSRVGSGGSHADRSLPGGAGTIVGQQRIDGAQGAEIPFTVPFERDQINNKHAYSIAASVVDGGQEWQNVVPVPVITGGPTEDVAVAADLAPDVREPGVHDSGTIVVPEGTELSPSAVAYAAIFNATSGRLVARQVVPSPITFPIPFIVGFDARPDRSGGILRRGRGRWWTERRFGRPTRLFRSIRRRRWHCTVAQRPQTIPPAPAAERLLQRPRHQLRRAAHAHPGPATPTPGRQRPRRRQRRLPTPTPTPDSNTCSYAPLRSRRQRRHPLPTRRRQQLRPRRRRHTGGSA